jgi:diphosphomevalonate decarboxylase
MRIRKQDVVRRILAGRTTEPRDDGAAFAPSNIALCKYWGKRDEELNLPVTASLSLSMGNLGSRVRITKAEHPDVVWLNGRRLARESSFARRVSAFLDLFRPSRGMAFKVIAENTVPTAAGFASSASGFAALTMALDDLFGWNLGSRELSILARLGSGSACRSVYDGFVEWRRGTRRDGMDSHAVPMNAAWPDLRMGLLVITEKEKATGSRAAMKQTVATCALYAGWPGTVQRDLATIKRAIRRRDFPMLGRTAEGNALAMHATMIATRPPVLYWLPESVAAMRRVWELRASGRQVYFTMDAGPNLKLIFRAKDTAAVKKAFLGIRIVAPFA